MVFVGAEDKDEILDLVEDAWLELFGIGIENETDLERVHEKINIMKYYNQMDKERRGISLGR